MHFKTVGFYPHCKGSLGKHARSSLLFPLAMKDFDIEIVGLLSSIYGHSCSVHACCGKHVDVRDILRLVRTIVTIGNKSEIAVKCVKVVDRVDSCTVGFIPMPKISTHINKFVFMKKLYNNPHRAVLLNKNAGQDE